MSNSDVLSFTTENEWRDISYTRHYVSGSTEESEDRDA